MSALPITPTVTPTVSMRPVRARPRLRLVVADGADRTDRAAAERDPGDAQDPTHDRGTVAADVPTPSLAPRSAAQALRRRVVAAVAVGALVAGVAAGVGTVLADTGPVAPAPPMVPASLATVVVQPGDTVWSIAAAHAPTGVATGEYAAMVVEVNGLDGGAVQPWQVLRLPTP